MDFSSEIIICCVHVIEHGEQAVITISSSFITFISACPYLSILGILG